MVEMVVIPEEMSLQEVKALPVAMAETVAQVVMAALETRVFLAVVAPQVGALVAVQ
jgi:hypothetical protein